MPDYFLIDVVCDKAGHEFDDGDLEPADYPVLIIETDGESDSAQAAVQKYRSRLRDLENPRIFINSPLGLRVTPLSREVWRTISLKQDREADLLAQIADIKVELAILRTSITLDMQNARTAPDLCAASGIK